FDRLCKEFEQMDPLTYHVLLAEKSAKLLPRLAKASNGLENGATLFATFILGAIAADGKVSEDEYLLCYPALRLFFGDEIDYNTVKHAVKFFKPESKELKECVNALVDALGEDDEDLKADAILVCMMICAIDGKISLKEKKWIKQLID
ncbi:MAG: TerB family tellurite resistance protein, partial [Clostridia bacterium]|nr:TerB family tellurite resistance protein [Clostridia bacterium]